MNKTDRFFNSKWGIFNHLFFALQLTPEEQKTKTITEFVDGIDTDLIAKQVHEMGAGYYFVSIFQANQALLLAFPSNILLYYGDNTSQLFSSRFPAPTFLPSLR